MSEYSTIYIGDLGVKDLIREELNNLLNDLEIPNSVLEEVLFAITSVNPNSKYYYNNFVIVPDEVLPGKPIN